MKHVRRLCTRIKGPAAAFSFVTACASSAPRRDPVLGLGHHLGSTLCASGTSKHTSLPPQGNVKSFRNVALETKVGITNDVNRLTQWTLTQSQVAVALPQALEAPDAAVKLKRNLVYPTAVKSNHKFKILYHNAPTSYVALPLPIQTSISRTYRQQLTAYCYNLNRVRRARLASNQADINAWTFETSFDPLIFLGHVDSVLTSAISCGEC